MESEDCEDVGEEDESAKDYQIRGLRFCWLGKFLPCR